MRLSLLLFAALRERAGAGSVVLEVPEGATAGDVPRLAGDQYPALGALGAGVRVARNQAFAAPDERLAPGDELALIPPVSGG